MRAWITVVLSLASLPSQGRTKCDVNFVWETNSPTARHQAIGLSVLFKAFRSLYTASMRQISLAYSAMVRSEENLPLLQIFTQHFFENARRSL